MATPDPAPSTPPAPQGPYKSSYKKTYTITPLTISIEETEEATHPPAPCGCGGGGGGSAAINVIMDMIGKMGAQLGGMPSVAAYPPPPADDEHSH